jgi:hypothetical protein
LSTITVLACINAENVNLNKIIELRQQGRVRQANVAACRGQQLRTSPTLRNAVCELRHLEVQGSTEHRRDQDLQERDIAHHGAGERIRGRGRGHNRVLAPRHNIQEAARHVQDARLFDPDDEHELHDLHQARQARRAHGVATTKTHGVDPGEAPSGAAEGDGAREGHRRHGSRVHDRAGHHHGGQSGEELGDVYRLITCVSDEDLMYINGHGPFPEANDVLDCELPDLPDVQNAEDDELCDIDEFLPPSHPI